MSLPSREVGLEEASILNLIGDYFEVGGHAECLLAVEHLCNGPETPLPLELAVLREMVLSGRWDHVMKYLDRFGSAEDEEGLKKCRYLAHKQKFLEILHYVESDIQARIRLGFSYCDNGELLSAGEADKVRQVVEAQLATLEPFCPSREDYLALQMLLSLPSISSSKDFSTWQLQAGRLDTLHKIQEWVSKALYLNVKLLPGGEGSRSCTLLRLLAKGLLYEQCERLCRTRCGETNTAERVSNMLDLRGWIQQQPDSSFQLPPSELSLMVSPWVRPSPPSLQSSQSVDTEMDSGIELHRQINAAKSVSSTLPLPVQPTMQPMQRPHPSQRAGNKSAVPMPRKEDTIHPSCSGLQGNAVDISPSNPAAETKKTTDQVLHPQPRSQLNEVTPTLSSTVPGAKQPAEQAKEETILLTPLHSNEPDGHAPTNDEDFLPSTTPLRKTSRGSSTPRNVKTSQASLKTSPPSSPIQGTAAHVEGRAKKRILFQSGPTISLLSTVTDSQVRLLCNKYRLQLTGWPYKMLCPSP